MGDHSVLETLSSYEYVRLHYETAAWPASDRDDTVRHGPMYGVRKQGMQFTCDKAKPEGPDVDRFAASKDG